MSKGVPTKPTFANLRGRKRLREIYRVQLLGAIRCQSKRHRSACAEAAAQTFQRLREYDRQHPLNK